MTPDLFGLPLPDLAQHLDEVGVGARHAARVFGGIHRLGLPLHAIPDLGRHATTIADSTWQATATVVQSHLTEDGTDKLVIALHDGARVEAVLIPMFEGRLTLCVSTQVGCAMACSFCATGTLGLSRHLLAGEIVAQVQAARAHAHARGARVHRLVFMGMGEPFHNYDATANALRVLLDRHGTSFASKAITVSTVGLVPRMRRFSEDFGGRVGLALSLHAGTDATRIRIIPAARSAPLAELKAALLAHPLPGSRWLMIEVVVLPGVNDTDAELDGIADFVRGLRALVNVIPFNPIAGAPFRSPTREEVVAMSRGLTSRGVIASIRWPRGRDAQGACGQLVLAHESATA